MSVFTQFNSRALTDKVTGLLPTGATGNAKDDERLMIRDNVCSSRFPFEWFSVERTNFSYAIFHI